MSILEDDVNQRKGVVAIGYEVDPPLSSPMDRGLARRILALPLSLPCRPAGYHLCTDSEYWVGILDMVLVTLCKFIRLRMKIHHGR